MPQKKFKGITKETKKFQDNDNLSQYMHNTSTAETQLCFQCQCQCERSSGNEVFTIKKLILAWNW